MTDNSETPVILASASPTRARLLESAGVAFTVVPAEIDEAELRAAVQTQGGDGAAMAEILAERKACQVSLDHPGRLVIGADQVLECGGRAFEKPVDPDRARAQLVELAGREHEQISSVAVARDGERLWHHTDRARLTMRTLSDGFLETYLTEAGDAVLSGPGAYRIEGIGAQLFSRIDGDYFTILGLPLIPLLDYLRTVRVLPE